MKKKEFKEFLKYCRKAFNCSENAYKAVMIAPEFFDPFWSTINSIGLLIFKDYDWDLIMDYLLDQCHYVKDNGREFFLKKDKDLIDYFDYLGYFAE